MPELYFDPHAPVPIDYAVVRLDTPVMGVLDAGEVWDRAQGIEWGPEAYRTRFRACWDAEALHVRWDAVDPAPWHTMTSRDDHIWEEEVVELFLDADGSGRNYAELEISPANVVCDLRVESPWPALRSVTAWDWDGMESRVAPLAGGEAGWTAVARLPWRGLRSLYPDGRVPLPPAPQDAWRFNVFRIKRPGGPARPEDGAIYAAWSRPSGPSFHDPDAFRPLRFLP
ncbi:MAG TPA: carbohydrate-binding family 9-like protein [Vicinamibacterales bacterium]